MQFFFVNKEKLWILSTEVERVGSWQGGFSINILLIIQYFPVSSQLEKIECHGIPFQNAKRQNSGSESDLVIRRCKYKLRSIKKGEGEDDGVGGPRKRGPKPRLRSAGMSR